mgnify:CR=1 FL=1
MNNYSYLYCIMKEYKIGKNKNDERKLVPNIQYGATHDNSKTIKLDNKSWIKILY